MFCRLSHRASDLINFFERNDTMNRRELFGTLGATAVALGAYSSVQAQVTKKPAKDDDHAGDHEHEHGHFNVCAKACANCQLLCHSCHHHCEELVADGKKQHVKTMKLCSDCGDICALAANIVSRHGPLSVTVCEACAKACDDCGKACAQFADDEHMKKCAQECQKCAAACREMIKHSGYDH